MIDGFLHDRFPRQRRYFSHHKPSQYVNLFLLKVNIIDRDWQALVSSLSKTQKGDEHIVIAFSYEKIA